MVMNFNRELRYLKNSILLFCKKYKLKMIFINRLKFNWEIIKNIYSLSFRCNKNMLGDFASANYSENVLNKGGQQ